MEERFPTLERIKMLLLKDKLSRWAPYQAARRDSDAMWETFCASHGEALRHEVLHLADQAHLVFDREADAAFCLGLQLGMELGGLDGFWDVDA